MALSYNLIHAHRLQPIALRSGEEELVRLDPRPPFFCSRPTTSVTKDCNSAMKCLIHLPRRILCKRPSGYVLSRDVPCSKSTAAYAVRRLGLGFTLTARMTLIAPTP